MAPPRGPFRNGVVLVLLIGLFLGAGRYVKESRVARLRGREGVKVVALQAEVALPPSDLGLYLHVGRFVELGIPVFMLALIGWDMCRRRNEGA